MECFVYDEGDKPSDFSVRFLFICERMAPLRRFVCCVILCDVANRLHQMAPVTFTQAFSDFSLNQVSGQVGASTSPQISCVLRRYLLDTGNQTDSSSTFNKINVCFSLQKGIQMSQDVELLHN